MCGVPAFGHTKKCFSASRNRCKISRYFVYISLLMLVAFMEVDMASEIGVAWASSVFSFCKI